jgi:hypothetical protein
MAALKSSWAFGAYKRGMGTLQSHYREQFACLAVKKLLTAAGFSCNVTNSKIGALAGRQIKAFQQAHVLVADGEVGPRTMRVLLRPTYLAACDDHGVVDPNEWAGCQMGWESALDPGAEYVNQDSSLDRGLYQYNSTRMPLTEDQAFDPLYTIDFRVNAEAAFAVAIAADCDKNGLDKYKISVSANRSPVGAKFWSTHPGVQPVDHRGESGSTMTDRDWAEFCAFYMTRVDAGGRDTWIGVG